MKVFVVVSAVLALAAAKPSTLVAPLAYAPVPVAVAAPFIAPISSQYHAQDSLGQYTYGYASGLSAKTEAKSVDGVTRGGYAYVDADGKLQSVEYTSDAVHGFRVAATNLPVAPAVPEVKALPQPVPVEDTPEVAEAKAKHLAAVEEAKTAAVVAPVSVEVKSAPAPLVAAPILAAPVLAAPALSTYSLIGYPGIAAYSAPWLAPVVAAAAPAATTAAPEAEAAAEVKEGSS